MLVALSFSILTTTAISWSTVPISADSHVLLMGDSHDEKTCISVPQLHTKNAPPELSRRCKYCKVACATSVCCYSTYLIGFLDPKWPIAFSKHLNKNEPSDPLARVSLMADLRVNVSIAKVLVTVGIWEAMAIELSSAFTYVFEEGYEKALVNLFQKTKRVFNHAEIITSTLTDTSPRTTRFGILGHLKNISRNLLIHTMNACLLKAACIAGVTVIDTRSMATAFRHTDGLHFEHGFYEKRLKLITTSRAHDACTLYYSYGFAK